MQQRKNDKNASICRVHPPEMGRLERGNDPIKKEQQPAERTKHDTSAITQPKPYEILSAYLHESSYHKQRD